MLLSNFPRKVVLKKLTSYLVFPDFVGPTVNALNGMLSGFMLFFIYLVHKLFELSRRAVVTTSKSCYLIFSYYSLIIICTQSYLV